MDTLAAPKACPEVCPCRTPCPIAGALKIVGGRWKMRLLCTLYVDGPQRYGVLAKKTAGVTSAMLAASLRELEEDGIVTRTQYPGIPPKVEYALTERGRSLWPILHRLAHWATGEPFDGDEEISEGEMI